MNRSPRGLLSASILAALAGPLAVHAATMDTTPPVLASLDVGTSVDVIDPKASLRIDWSITDDLSGFAHGYAIFTGPTGQHVTANLAIGVGLPRLDLASAVGIQRWMVPGTWTLSGVYLWDQAGNGTYLDAAAVRAVPGNHQFTVANRTGGDDVPPALVSGSIRTPTVSQSALVPGTLQHVPAAVVVKAKDTGHGGVRSGAWWVNMTFCIAGTQTCMTVTNAGSNLQPDAIGTLVATGPAGYVQGVYQLVKMTLGDQANNLTSYTSTTVGGSTDFSAYFDTTSITVVP